jgi:hypothetical protein
VVEELKLCKENVFSVQPLMLPLVLENPLLLDLVTKNLAPLLQVQKNLQKKINYP